MFFYAFTHKTPVEHSDRNMVCEQTHLTCRISNHVSNVQQRWATECGAMFARTTYLIALNELPQSTFIYYQSLFI